ncbi:MAG: hypothetical protein AABX90_00645 [Nanoarchaeota archaeon]
MQESKKQRLEGMLRAIQDLKAENYIGTQDAWKTLKDIEALYSKPSQISSKINQALNNPAYKATPERLCGLVDLFSAIDDLSVETFDCDAVNAYYFTDAREDFLSSGTNYLGILVFDSEKNVIHSLLENEIEKTEKELTNLFKLANESGLKTDSEFGQFFIDYVSEEIKKRKDILPEFETQIAEVQQAVAAMSCNLDFEKLFSIQSLRDAEREGLTATLIHSTTKLYARLKNDRLDHRFEYRRQLLTNFLRSFLHRFDEPPAYEEIKDFLDHKVLDRKRRVYSWRSLNGPDEIIKREEEVYESYKFLRLLLGAEKSFVIKYISN